jgi:hypothetical protein
MDFFFLIEEHFVGKEGHLGRIRYIDFYNLNSNLAVHTQMGISCRKLMGKGIKHVVW